MQNYNHFKNSRSEESTPILCLQRIWLAGLLAIVVAGIAGCTGESTVAVDDDASRTNSSIESGHSANSSSEILTRLFWQDRGDGLVYYGDLSLRDDKFDISKSTIKGFPELSADENSLVQMEVAHGRLVVGVRDRSDGQTKSGWVEIDTGVKEENHGDHSHWQYPAKASVFSTTLDIDQGNPAHVYRYGKYIYIANDKKNGFTQIDTSIENGPSKAEFFQGGGGHITLAAVASRIAYSTWIDRSGDNSGRVDVVDLRSQSSEPRYSFRLPVGGIHGAGACGNRVFFAPSHGVYWVDCDFDFTENSESVSIEHLSLDADAAGTDYRTGAFESFEDHILCIANSKTGAPSLCIINGTAPSPVVTRIQCNDLQEGLKMSTVKATQLAGNKKYAFAFAEGTGLDERLLVFDLDPNGDRSFNDAKLLKAMKVGASKVEGHSGHHGITFLGNNNFAVITNPGDGTLSIIDLVKMEASQTISVGGTPTSVTCYGEAM